MTPPRTSEIQLSVRQCWEISVSRHSPQRLSFLLLLLLCCKLSIAHRAHTQAPSVLYLSLPILQPVTPRSCQSTTLSISNSPTQLTGVTFMCSTLIWRLHQRMPYCCDLISKHLVKSLSRPTFHNRRKAIRNRLLFSLSHRPTYLPPPAILVATTPTKQRMCYPYAPRQSLVLRNSRF